MAWVGWLVWEIGREEGEKAVFSYDVIKASNIKCLYMLYSVAMLEGIGVVASLPHSVI